MTFKPRGIRRFVGYGLSEVLGFVKGELNLGLKDLITQLAAIIPELEKNTSGTYTPQFTNGTNGFGTPTPELFSWSRVGNRVHVQGQIRDFPLTAANTSTLFDITIPIPARLLSNITVQGHIVATNTTPSIFKAGFVLGDSANNNEVRGYFDAPATTNNYMVLTFSYLVI